MKFYLKEKKYAAVILILILLSAPLYGQDLSDDVATGPEEPTETEIILPEMYLEIEDLTIEEIDAVIPDDDTVFLSKISLMLPQPDEIEIPIEVFAVQTPLPGVSGQGDAAAGGSDFYSEGVIGAGTASNITGDINLYHIGGRPDFRLRYYHNGYDGFSGRQAGEGFSSREELIEAEVNFDLDELEAGLLVSYNEEETGLQGIQPDYYSVTRRAPSVSADGLWRPSEKLSLTGELAADMARIQLNSLNTPAGFSIYSLEPQAGIIYGTEKVKIGAGMNYSIRGEFYGGGLVQDFGGGLLFNAAIADIFSIDADANVLWHNWQQAYFPFEIELSGIAPTFDYMLRGGLKAFYTDWADIWGAAAVAGGPAEASAFGVMPLTHGWFGEGEFGWNISNDMALRTSLAFSSYSGAPLPVPSALDGFYTVSAADSICLTAGADLFMNITEQLTLNAGWKGQLLEEMNWYEPRHVIRADAELVSADRRFGLKTDVEMNIYDASQTWFVTEWLPVMGFEGYFRISEGFEFSVSGEDVAAPLLNEGRYLWGGYLDKGAVLQAKIKISL